MARLSIEQDGRDPHAAAVRPAPSIAVLALIVAAIAVLPYLNTLRADFTFDDVHLIRDNPAVQLQPSVGLLRYVYQPGALYRPLTMLTYAANASVSRAPFGYHLVNLALHVLTTLAVFFLALRLLRGRAAATAAALLFAVHPIHTEAVTNIVGRAELLAALAVLVALLACARALGSSGAARGLWTALSLGAFAAGLLAKESACTGIGLIAVLHWRLERSAGLRRRIAVLLPYGAVVAAYLMLRRDVVGSIVLPAAPDMLDNPLAYVSASARIRTAVVVLWEYVSLLAVPLHLSADYSYDQIPVAATWTDPRFLITTALLAALVAALLAVRRRAPALAVAALFTAIPLALTANLLFPIGTIKAERLLYLPSVGWCLGVGWLAAVALRQRLTVWAVALAAVLAAFGAQTWMRNGDWRDNTTLFHATLADAPDSAKAHYNVGVALQREGGLDDAMLHYRRALAIYPDYASAALGIGLVYARKGIEGGALQYYEQAVRLDPRYAKAHLQVGLLRQSRGEYDSAEAAYLTGLDSDPDDPVLLVNLGALRLAQGDRWRAGAILARLAQVGTMDADDQQVVAAAQHEIEVALR